MPDARYCSRTVLTATLLILLSGMPLVDRLVEAKDRGVVNNSSSPHVRLRSVDLDDVKWTDGFWADKFELCRREMIPGVQRALGDERNAAQLRNFRVAAGLDQGQHRGTNWGDGDCYKWLEALAHVYAVTGDANLDRLMDEWIEVIGKAQADDGYISTNIQLTGGKRFANPHHHEMYNMGHLLNAACIHHRATGKDSFLLIARKLGDYLYGVFQPRPPQLAHFGWNPSNIMGLAELYRTTRDPRYLELAGIFVDMRGSAGGTDLTQDRVPLRKETEAVGHCVCATYLYCGAADVCAETGDRQLRDALERIWQNMTTRRMYVTGAIGSGRGGRSSRGDPVHEAFGLDYELPSRTAYCETCANVGNAMWNWRMLALSGDARYADLMELVLYNSMLSAVGTDGRGFFYANPLHRDGRREGLSYHHTDQRWSVHRCFCCPPQVIRTIAKLGGWAYSVSSHGVWVNLYGGNTLQTELLDGSALRLTQQTEYPWQGEIKITLEEAPDSEFAVMLRIPGWAGDARLLINGKSTAAEIRPGTYVALRHRWSPGDVISLSIPMKVRLLEAHPAVENLRNKVAAARGPVVYCLEVPLADDDGRLWREGVFLPDSVEFTPRFRNDLLGGMVVLRGEGLTFKGRDDFVRQAAEAERPAAKTDWPAHLYREFAPRTFARPRSGTVEITLIPYHAWANRGVSFMEVWIPLAR